MGPFRRDSPPSSDDRPRHRHDFFDPGEVSDPTVDPHAVGAVAAEHRRNLHALEFGIEDDDEHSDGDRSELEALYGKGPRLEPREQIRRTLLSGGMVLLGCVVFVYVTVTIKGMQNGGGSDAGAGAGAFAEGSPALEPIVGGGKDRGHFHVSEDTVAEFTKWSKELYEHTGLTGYDGGEPEVDWSLGHPKSRKDRFPSVEERVKYYMGRFYEKPAPEDVAGGSAVDAWGDGFLEDTWELRLSTRRFSISSSFVVNLYDFDTSALIKCDEEENTVLHAYCRDYVDFAILHKDMSAGAVQHLGDSLPRTSPNKAKMGVSGRGGGYPVFNKVRNYCDIPAQRTEKYPDYLEGERSSNCDKPNRIDTVLWPLNRHRHLTPAAQLGGLDTPWEEKLPKAIWRGGTNDALSDRKHDLVSKHVGSAAVDAKFAERDNKRGRHGDKTAGIPEEWLGPFITKDEQLKYRYLISIEGNDVSSGLKWMLFSNSVVMLPPTTFESWAMEGLLEPYVHYLPIKADMSDVESQIAWAESRPSDARRIAQRSTLFVYDLLFHPDALSDERAVLRGIAERYEENFGYLMDARAKHPLGWVKWEDHPERREDRFPSVEERVRYCMGRWYDDDEEVDMARREDEKGKTILPDAVSGLDDRPKLDAPFVATGRALSDCASSARAKGPDRSSGADALILSEYCDDALPFFDERLIYDIVSTRHPDEDPSFKLAPETEDMTPPERKWYKRILVDDSAKALHFGERPPSPPHGEEDGGEEGGDEEGGRFFPVFAGARRATEAGGGAGKNNGDFFPGGGAATILWRFGSSRGGYDLVRSGTIERLDVPFASKEPRAVWRGGIGTAANPPGEDGGGGGGEEFARRKSLVERSAAAPGGKVDARFVLPGSVLERGGAEGGSLAGVPEEMMTAEPQGEGELSDHLRSMLKFRYILATEDDYRPNADLKWMLLSRSVVLLPPRHRFSTWFPEDFLEPFVHFVPVAEDYSDAEDLVDWCERHPEEAERIAERATLFVHDMLFHRDAKREEDEVRLGIMERYAERFGG